MRITQFIFAVMLMVQVSVGHLLAQDSKGKEEGNVAFKWAFGVAVGEGEGRTLTSITKDTALKSGDDLKMVVQLQNNCFVYVLYLSSTGELDLLFPYDVKQFKNDYSQGRNYYIPEGRSWFTLDKNLGRETFYLVASKSRLHDLESKVEKYRAAKASTKANLAKDVVAEIRDLKKRYKSYATLAERPISIGGNVRGKPTGADAPRPDVADIAVEIVANNFYSKTFTIEHQ